jgi:hypothetical protein
MNLEQRGNLIIRIKAMEEEAAQTGKTLTVLCLYSTKDAQTVKESIEPFNLAWSRVRATLKRSDIEASGLRIIEPMKNGTPKFFIMFYSDSKNEKTIQDITKHFFSTHNFEIKAPKAINTTHNQVETFANKRYSAPPYLDQISIWSKIHGIRLFTFFGQTKTAI